MVQIDAAVKEFRSTFSGTVIEPGDASYDDERALFNAMIDKRPRLIARCASVADVQSALDFGRSSGLEIGVRSGGHSVAGLSTNEGGIVIDLRGINAVRVDAGKRLAYVGGGANWGEFDAACLPHNLAATGGRVTTTGVAGLTLGGGSGWMERNWGLACDNLVEVELVTADGNLVRASETENPELFWALHGGGGNFGIATSFTFNLFPVPDFAVGMLLWNPRFGKEVARAYREVIAGAPDQLGGGLGFMTAPPMEFVPAHVQGTVVCGILTPFAGEAAELEALIKPLEEIGPPDVALVMPLPYHTFNGMLDDEPGLQNWWTADYHDELSDAMIDDFVDYASALTPGASQMFMLPWGGAVAAEERWPLANRHSRWVTHPFALWENPSENEERIAWARGLAQKMKKYSNGGTYLNFIGHEGEERIIAAFGIDSYERMQKVKAEYDPDNVFRGNQNIKPAR